MTTASIAVAAYATARRTLPPMSVVVELYDIALTSVAHARDRRAKGHFEKEFEALSKAADIFQGLDLCLNRSDERADALAKTLHAYYQRTLTQLHAAKRAKSDVAIDIYSSVYRQILNMREAWAKLAGSAGMNPATLAASSAKTADYRAAFWA